MNKKAFNPNEATLENLNGGIQFVPKFIGQARNFIMSHGGIFKRNPYGSETFRQIRVRDALYELGLFEAPQSVKDAFDYFTGSYDNLVRELVSTGEFHTKRIRSASMKKTAAAGPYTILLDLEQDIRRGYASFDWDKWVFAMGHAKGADYVVGDAGGAIVTNLIRLHLEGSVAEMDKKRVWRILTGNIRLALENNEIFRGLIAERSFDIWKEYTQTQRSWSVASELVKIAKELVAEKREISRAELSRLLGGRRFKLKKVGFSDLARGYAYTLEVDGVPCGPMSTTVWEANREILKTIKDIKNNYSYDGTHIL